MLTRFKYLIWACIGCSVIACDAENNSEITWGALSMSTEAKSCVFLDEGCGKSDVLFAPKLDPDCGIERNGEEVVISGTFAARWNILSNTYIPWPADAWKPAAATQYGYVIFEPDENNPSGSVIEHRRKCMHYNTKVMGSRTIYYEEMFYLLPTFSFQVDAVSDVWRIGDDFVLRRGWETWGLSEDYDVLTMDLPTSADSSYVIDEDEDGKPGVTISTESPVAFVEGDYYIIQESDYDEELMICSEYQIQGTQTNHTSFQETLGSNTAITDQKILMELKPGSTVLYVKISESTEMPDPAEICDRIMSESEEIFGGQGEAEITEEILDDDLTE
jgi:hypothetical protein